MSEKKILRLPVVEGKTGKGHSSIYQDIKAGTFPPPVKIGKRSVGWLESEIDSWIDSRESASGTAAARRADGR